MKKSASFLIVLLFVFCFAACGGSTKGGSIEGAETREVASELYSQQEINDAIDTIESEFRQDWSGCTLTEICYAGDEVSSDYQEWADRNNADDVIVLISTFDVDESGGDGSLNSNSTYHDWLWILVRTNGGRWKHVDHGY